MWRERSPGLRRRLLAHLGGGRKASGRSRGVERMLPGAAVASPGKGARSSMCPSGCNYPPILRMGKSILRSRGTEPGHMSRPA